MEAPQLHRDMLIKGNSTSYKEKDTASFWYQIVGKLVSNFMMLKISGFQQGPLVKLMLWNLDNTVKWEAYLELRPVVLEASSL